MKKFKVIEESRFLNNEEMDVVKGGCMGHLETCHNLPNPMYETTPPQHELCNTATSHGGTLCLQRPTYGPVPCEGYITHI